MVQKAGDIRLDILIKKESDHFSAHCLQFDLVTTADTLDEVKKAILEVCSAHIQFSYQYDNAEHLFSPAPKEVWAEYYRSLTQLDCPTNVERLEIPPEEDGTVSVLPAFMIQEILYTPHASC